MNFNNYIPNDKMSILYGITEIPILGAYKFRIDIEKLRVFYEIYICQDVFDMNPYIRDEIKIRLKINSFITPCEVTEISQNDENYHIYCMSLYCDVDQDNHLEEKQSRFEILDL